MNLLLMDMEKILKNIPFLKDNFSEEFINKLCIEVKEMTLVTNEILVT